MSLSLKISSTAIAAGTALLVLCAAGPAQAAPGNVGAADFLGTALPFTVVAGSTVTNTGPSLLPGNLGVSPGSALTGFTAEMLGGSTHSNDAVAINAQGAIGVAAGALLAVPSYNIGTANMDGSVFVAGSYSSPSTLLNNGTITLNGDADDVFIFTAVSALTTGAGSTIVLTGGAQECNVFWRLGSAATLGAGSRMVGTVIAQSSISAVTGATIAGKLFAQTEAVTLQSNRFTAATCDTTGGNGDIWRAGEPTGTEPTPTPPVESEEGPTGPVLPIPEDTDTPDDDTDTDTGTPNGGGGGTGESGGSSAGGSSLAATGSDPTVGVLAGAGALGLGLAIVLYRRRSRLQS